MRGRAARTLYDCFLAGGGAAVEGETPDDWIGERFRAINVFPKPIVGYWDKTRAREKASALKVREISWVVGDRVVLLGRRVAEAMGHGDLRFFETWSDGRVRFWLAPHPSGHNLLMNDPETRRRLGALLVEAIES